jgi:HEAT repeat protein
MNDFMYWIEADPDGNVREVSHWNSGEIKFTVTIHETVGGYYTEVQVLRLKVTGETRLAARARVLDRVRIALLDVRREGPEKLLPRICEHEIPVLLAWLGSVSVAALIEVLRNSRGEALTAAALALVLIGKPSVDSLVACLDAAGADLRATIVRCLGEIAGAQGTGSDVVSKTRTALWRLVTNDDEEGFVRQRAIDVLADLNDVRVVPLILPRLEHATEKTLCRLAEISTEPFKEALVHQSSAMRHNAIKVLDAVGDRSAAALLLARLGDSDFHVRYASFNLLNRLGIAMAEKLESLLSSENADVRVDAARNLRRLSREPHKLPAKVEYFSILEDALSLSALGESAIPALIRLLDSQRCEDAAQQLIRFGRVAVPYLVRPPKNLGSSWRIPRILTSIGEPAVKPLLAALADSDGDTQVHACGALCAFPAEAIPAESFINVLSDSLVAVRRLAAQALNRYPDDCVLSALIDATSDSDEDVRLKAAMRLSRSQDERVASPLLRLLGDANPTTRMWAAEGLARFGSERVDIGLATRFAAESDPGIRRSLIKTLASRIGQRTEEVTLAMLAAVRSDDPEIRKDAVSSFEKIPDERAFDHLIRLTNDDDYSVRARAVSALATNWLDHSLNLIVSMLGDGSLAVRSQTQKSLSAVPSPKVSAKLLAVVRSEASILGRVRRLGRRRSESRRDRFCGAAEVLARFRERKSTRLFLSALHDHDDRIAAAAAEALGTLRATAAVEPLCKLLRTRNRDVKDAVVHALCQLRGSRSIEPLIEYFIDHNCYPNEVLTMTADILEHAPESVDLPALKMICRLPSGVRRPSADYDTESNQSWEFHSFEFVREAAHRELLRRGIER